MTRSPALLRSPVPWLLFLLALLPPPPGDAESREPDAEQVRALVQAFKNDPRGPYKAIRWFCKDGAVLPASTPCPEPGGIQHAVPKDAVRRLAAEQGIHLGQILAGTPSPEFLDASSENARLKQYLMEKYLQRVDDGWIVRRARFYRGAVQQEDEEAWGRGFLRFMASDDEICSSDFFLLREAAAGIPHRAAEDRWKSIRDRARNIAELAPAFNELRIKIHGQPDSGDVQRLEDFLEKHRDSLPPEAAEQIRVLKAELEGAYRAADIQSLAGYLKKLPGDLPVAASLRGLLAGRAVAQPGPGRDPARDVPALADLLLRIRTALPAVRSPKTRVDLLDLSVDLEKVLFLEANEWHPKTVGELLEKNHALAMALAGCGYLELWEWEAVAPDLLPLAPDARMSLADFQRRAGRARRTVEWGTGRIRAAYGPTVALFSRFEPLAEGFVDDRIHASPLLPAGRAAARLDGMSARLSGVAGRVFGKRVQQEVRGINPGFAVGELVVAAGPVDPDRFSPDRIYALARAPADLRPVAGILTVSEGNLVSHVQLLARNLGIPSVVMSEGVLRELEPRSGERVFLAAAPGGSVLLKAAGDMTARERALTEKKKQREERVSVPVDKVNLGETGLRSLATLRASDSGRICGPKAANLGELKRLFPDRVVDGLVIPFGVFRAHMGQPMPGTGGSCWDFLRETFAEAERLRGQGEPPEAVDAFVLERLRRLREAIRGMAFLPGFREQLAGRFREVLGADPGRVPVFVRSDTNMEDLKDFTGAGLNLTVFNVLQEEAMLQAVRDVWASPFTERSYRWRQRVLLNPENVYPSILLLPSVDVEKSGVMITRGVTSGEAGDDTVAFSRGAGGAVEGQAAETWLLRQAGEDLLLSPSRETGYTRLPETGGTARGATALDRPLLGPDERLQLRAFSGEVRRKLPGTPGVETAGPFDVELGFRDGRLWLFQVRPYVENRRAQSSEYLRSLDRPVPGERWISPGDPVGDACAHCEVK